MLDRGGAAAQDRADLRGPFQPAGDDGSLRALVPQRRSFASDGRDLIKLLRHPFLLQTQAYSQEDDRLFIVMELADKSLRDRLKECRAAGLQGIPVTELLTYFKESAEALDFLHEKHILHRDIKPENILLLQGHAKVADFGLAKGQQSHMATATGSGTPLYMAPEVWRNKLSAQSDQYSLALAYAELRLDRRQPHLCAAFHTRHFYAGLKPRAGWCRPKCLQHLIPMRLKSRDATPPTTGP